MKVRKPTKTQKRAYIRSIQTEFREPSKDHTLFISRRKQSDHKKKYETDNIDIAYPSFLLYQKTVGRDKAYNYLTVCDVIEQLNVETINYMLNKHKSVKFTGLGIFRVYVAKGTWIDKSINILTISLKFNKSISRYITRYKLKPTEYFKRLRDFLFRDTHADFKKKDFIMINSTL